MPEVHERMRARKQRLFDEHGERDLRAARARANQFETIANACFQNRAAMKMANLDAVCNWLISDAQCEVSGDLGVFV
jgi:cap1 methyltransferase